MPDPKLDKQSIKESYRAQQTDLDKIWFSIQMKAYAQTMENARVYSAPPDLDEVPSEQEREQILQSVRENGSQTRFSDAEKRELQIPLDEASIQAADDLCHKIDNGHRNMLRDTRTMDDEVKYYRQAGMLNAKICVEIGKEYYRNLERLDKDEPNRADKAFYLTMCDTDSKANMLMVSYKKYQLMQDMELTNTAHRMKMEASPAGDPEQLKKMTLDQYLDLSFRDRVEKEHYLEDCRRVGLNCTLESNAFDVLKHRSESAKKMQKSDEDIAQEAYENLYAAHRNMQGVYARKLAAAGLTPEEREYYAIGEMLTDANQKEYRPPKHIREWVEQKGKGMLRENRVAKLNQNIAEFGAALTRKEPMNVHKTSGLAGSYRSPGFFASSYDKYLAKHMGRKAVEGQTLEQQKAHLVRAVAAVAQQEGKRDFSTDRIHDWAKVYAGRDFFQKLTPRQVADALTDRKHLNDLRREMYRDRYGVPENDRADYIREMQKLQKNMMPKSGTSDQYKALSDAVAEIAKIDLNEKNSEAKLVVANGKLYSAIEDYSKGKKSVRITDDGKERFGNCMDALAVLSRRVPGLRKDAQAHEDRVNEVRNAPEGHRDHLDLSRFGADRSERAKELRDAKQAGQKPPEQSAVRTL